MIRKVFVTPDLELLEHTAAHMPDDTLFKTQASRIWNDVQEKNDRKDKKVNGKKKWMSAKSEERGKQ